MPKISYQEAKVPIEVQEYFDTKSLQPSFDYRDVWQEEHAIAFTVAKSTVADILLDIKQALSDSLSSGLTYQRFAKDLKPILQRKGWWGKQEVSDPQTGKSTLATLGSPRRLRIIYESNMRTARAAGQWARIQQRTTTHPYLLYSLGPSVEHRLEHTQWAGRIGRVDDPWFVTHFPPNGWGCKCSIRQISIAEAERLCRLPAYQDYRQRSIKTGKSYRWVNKRTGSIEKVPKGIDPGWGSNPGVTRYGDAVTRMQEKLVQIDPIYADQLAEEMNRLRQ